MKKELDKAREKMHDAIYRYCVELYTEVGNTAVYDFANETLGMATRWEYCEPCDAETPRIIGEKYNTCLCCGQ